ncbi:MAG: three-Cys-motif partner protein TcmP [Burkholderiales bacterium]|nr:three-Cys-motif partner protein TcmP [Burkholderiales bacterium]
MSSKLPTIWKAEPHTIAKIEMLRSYLFVWFSILGREFKGKDLWYIDGFAGPGTYTNYNQGSPIAALESASEAINSASAWNAGNVHCVFIENDKARFRHLERKLEEIPSERRVHRHPFLGTFVDGIAHLQQQSTNPFRASDPVFAFIDPFGPAEMSFSAVRELLSRPGCEVLVNLDSDGVSRIYSAGASANHMKLLDDVFGDSEWKEVLAGCDQLQAVRKVVSLYKNKLRAIPGVNYSFEFEMRKQNDVFDYHLVFASQHPRGLEKMKEVMKKIDKSGSYCFSDSTGGQQFLFQFDDPAEHANKLLVRFQGTGAPYKDVHDYALNESPFPNPKSMLKVLENSGKVSVQCATRRRAGQYPEHAQPSMVINFQN